MPVNWTDGSHLVGAENLGIMEDDIAAKQSLAEKAQANGYASLDANGKVPLVQLPPVGADLEYNGGWATDSYTDGDIVVHDGVAYLCVEPTTEAPVAWPGGGGVSGPAIPEPIPTPAKWLKGEGGAMVWADLPQDPALAVEGRVGQYARNMQVAGPNDWNQAVTNGWFMSSDAANAPQAGWLIGEVVAHNNDWLTQRVWAFTTGATMSEVPHFERKRNAGGWLSWEAQPRIYAGSWVGTLDSNAEGVVPFGRTFNNLPIVICAAGDKNNAPDANFSVGNVTTSNFTVHVQWMPNAVVRAHWLAIAGVPWS